MSIKFHSRRVALTLAAIGALGIGNASNATIILPDNPELATDASDGTPPSASQLLPYRINKDDKLKIKFFQRSELSSEFSVRADGNIFIPIVGRIHVSGRTIGELEALISRRFVSKTNQSAFISIEVIEHRPIYVVGAVTKPNAVSFKPGMRPLHAVALSGGIFRLNRTGPMGIQMVREQQRISLAMNTLGRLLSHRARLHAEVNGENKIEASPQLMELLGAKQAERVTSVERHILKLNAGKYKKRLADLQAAARLTDKELSALRASLGVVQTEEKVLRQEISGVKHLVERRLTHSARIYTLKYALSAVQQRASTIKASILRAQLSLARAIQQHEEYWPTQLQRILLETGKIEGQIEQNQLLIGSSPGMNGRNMNVSFTTMQNAGATSHVQYQIMRSINGQFVTFDATDTTSLKPGDVLKVSLANTLAPSQGKAITAQWGDMQARQGNRPAQVASAKPKARAVAIQHNAAKKQPRQLYLIRKGKLNPPDSNLQPDVNSQVKKKVKAQEGSLTAVAPTKNRGNQIARRLQIQLQRVGCYRIAVDGFWGPSSRNAMRRFNRVNRTRLSVYTPSKFAIGIVGKNSKRSCSKRVARR